MQTVADVILISDFLFTLTHQHLSIYHSSDSIFLSQSFADCINVHMIFLNLNDFTTPGYQFSTIHNVARGNRSELNLVR